MKDWKNGKIQIIMFKIENISLKFCIDSYSLNNWLNYCGFELKNIDEYRK